VKNAFVAPKVKYALTWILTIAILAILFSRIKFSDVLTAMKGVNVALLSLCIPVSFLAHLLIAPVRYGKILKQQGCSLSLSEAILVWAGTVPIRTITPFKAGDVSKVAYLKKTHNLAYSKGASSVFLGYAMTFVTLAFIILLGCSFYYFKTLQGVSFILLLSVILLFLVFKRMGRLKGIIVIFLYSLAFEGCKLINALILFKALNIEVQYGALLFFIPLTFLIAAVPVTFAGFGTRESLILLFFYNYATPQELLSLSFLISLFNRLFPIFLGLFFVKVFLNRLLAADRKGK